MASAAMFTVNSVEDALDAAPGNSLCSTAASFCSLRAAIQEANALAGTDTIVLPAGTYNLTIPGTGENAAAAGDLDITQNLTIVGDGANATIIDASGLGDRIFDVRSAAISVSFSGVTIRNAIVAGAGGGINALGSLTLTDSVVSGNTTTGSGGNGGGINGSGSITLDNSRVINNTAGGDGGGIRSSGPLMLRRCTVAGNRTTGSNTDGGGLNLSGDFLRAIVQSTISDNRANRYGGGVQSGTGSLDIVASTLHGNAANDDGGGIRVSGSTVSIEFATITNNSADADGNGEGDGGGLRRQSGTVTMINSILAENVDIGGQSPDCSGTLESVINTLIQNTQLCVPNSFPLAGVSPQLGTLRDNGGPTLTRAPLPGSPVIEGVPLERCNTDIGLVDQRGVTRPRYGDCDIGAFELEETPGTMFAVDSFSDTVDATPSDNLCATATGECTLRAAIQQANALPNPDAITIPAGTYSLSIVTNSPGMTDGLAITSPLALSGAGASNTTIQWDPSISLEEDIVFLIRASNVEISDVTIQRGRNGVYSIDGALVLTDVVVRETLLSGIENGANLTVANAVISGCLGGGLVNNRPGVAELTNVAIVGNGNGELMAFGGGIENRGRLTFTIGTVSGNTGLAGGIFNAGAPAEATVLTNVTISGNSARSSLIGVGGILGSGTFTNVTIADNSGGGIYVGEFVFEPAGQVVLKNSIVANDVDGEGVNRNCPGLPVVSLGHNLESGSSCGFAAAGDLSNTDPMLGPLEDNGGFTFTHALLPGSPAIDGGSFDCPPPHVDQRGVVRSSPCDIGAYEAVAGAAGTPTSTPIQTENPTATRTTTSIQVATPTSTQAAMATSTVTLTQIPPSTPSPLPTATAAFPTITPTATQTVPATGTPNATSTPEGTPSTVPTSADTTPTATVTPNSTATPEDVACVGDCDGSSQVTVDEIVTGVIIALGTRLADDCPAFDRDQSMTVTVDELVEAIQNALRGC
jgi:CSLREA domain-containing protein